MNEANKKENVNAVLRANRLTMRNGISNTEEQALHQLNKAFLEILTIFSCKVRYFKHRIID